MTIAAMKGMLNQLDRIDEIEGLVAEPPVKAARAAAPKRMSNSASFAALAAMEHADRSEASADRADAALEGCLRTVKFTQTVAKSTGLLVPQVDSRLSEHEEIFAGHRREVNNRIGLLETALKRTGLAVGVAMAISIPATAFVTASIVTNSVNSANSTQIR